MATREWPTFRVGLLSYVVTFMTGAFVLWKKGMDPSVNLILIYAVTLTEQVILFVQIYALVQQNLNSVDRNFENI